MIQLRRGSAPTFWTRENVRKWTDRWLEKECDSRRWKWPQVAGKRLNEHAMEALEPWHYGKCAFCETLLFSGKEIEHFRSKTHFPLAAFVWRNLFLICRNCNQAKGEQDHSGCIKPDRENPEEFLWVNPISLKMEPKPGITEKSKQRALKTIALFQLDRPDLTELYKRYLLQFFAGGPVISLMRFVLSSTDSALVEGGKLKFHKAKLSALMAPSRPFSLMIKSLIEY